MIGVFLNHRRNKVCLHVVFIEGIKHKAADINSNGKVSHAELLNYTREKSKQYCEARRGCASGLGLTPTLEAPESMLSVSVSSHSQFTDPPDIIDIIDEALPVKNQDSIVLDVEVAGKPSQQMRLGDALFIHVKSKKSGYLLVLDQNANGELRQIYPYKGNKHDEIKAGEEVFIPQDSSSYSVKATELGESQLIAIVVHDKMSLATLFDSDSPLVPNAKTYLTTLAQRLQATWTGDRVNRSVDYSLRKFAYRVVD